MHRLLKERHQKHAYGSTTMMSWMSKMSNNRKSRVCNNCGHEFKHLSLEQAVKHLDKCEEAQQQVDGLSALMDQVNLDRSAKKEKALVKSQQPARSRSILGKHARDSSQSTLDNRAKAIRVPPDEQMTIATAMLHFFVMCNIAFNMADSPWFRRILRFLHPGYKPPTSYIMRTSLLSTEHSKQGFQMILQATDFCVRRQWGEEKIRHLFEQMDAYKANTQDYQRSLAPGADPDEWWEVVGRNLPPEADKTPAIISVFARLLLSVNRHNVVPHAADPKRAFSAMGLDHSPLRNRFNEDTVSKMGLVRSHNRVSPPEDEEFKPKEVKDPGPSKQRSKVDDTDMGPLEVSDLDLYRACNPAPSAQQSASQAEHPAATQMPVLRGKEAMMKKLQLGLKKSWRHH
ncbi:TPA: hypothetical protein ACH3X1_003893 [Trebouxia sp. C0004]